MSRVRVLGLCVASALVVPVVSAVFAAPAARAATPTPGGGLPVVASGHRPGPDALYEAAPDAPQLQNTGIWQAPPILVEGAAAYRDGEWLYQDFLHDDHGATGAVDSNAPYGPSGFLFAPTGGSFTYPTDPVYADNSADLVETRIKPTATATAFRFTLDTLIDPSRVAITTALGTSAASLPWPHGAGVSSPAAYFLTVHGSTGELTNATTGAVLSPAPTVTVDLARRQVQVLVAHAAWDPTGTTVPTTFGVGLWDPAAGAYLAPAPGNATATTPGGGSPLGTAIVNVGPRLAEPMPVAKGGGYTIGDTAAAGTVQAAMWRERQQSEQLTLGDVSPFTAAVSFPKLAAGTDDESAVPSTGPIDRIFASHSSFGQGVDPTKICYDLASSFADGAACVGRFVGQLQDYALYVPAKAPPATGYGMTLLLHSLSANHNQYLSSFNASELGDRGTGSLVLTPEGRGPDGFYSGAAEADTFEAWADVARHYPLDQTLTSVSGYSMGGFGTFRYLARWPDLFAKGFSVVGAPGTVGEQLASLRNTPLLAWNGTADELVNVSTTQATVTALTAAGVRFENDLYANADHLTLAANDEYAPGAAFLGDARVDRDPAHVTYVVDPTEDSASARAVGDHAYWLSGLTPRATGDATADVLSLASGVGDAPVLPVAVGAGTLTGGAYVLGYASRTQAWGPAPAVAKSNALVVNATNLAAMTIDPARAGVTCGATLTVKSDGPVAITMSGCGAPVIITPTSPAAPAKTVVVAAAAAPKQATQPTVRRTTAPRRVAPVVRTGTVVPTAQPTRTLAFTGLGLLPPSAALLLLATGLLLRRRRAS